MKSIIKITILSILALIFISKGSLFAQVRPEVNLGVRYSSEKLLTYSHNNNPPALELGFGLKFNTAWYTGLDVNFLRTESSISEVSYYYFEIETKRYIFIDKLKRIDLGFSLSPGIVFTDCYLINDFRYVKKNYLSLAGAVFSEYLIVNDFRIVISAGYTSFPFLSYGSQKIRAGSYISAGLKYTF